MGVAWPTPRFVDAHPDTSTDLISGLLWTRSAQKISGKKTWAEALAACESFVLGQGCAAADKWCYEITKTNCILKRKVYVTFYSHHKMEEQNEGAKLSV